MFYERKCACYFAGANTPSYVLPRFHQGDKRRPTLPNIDRKLEELGADVFTNVQSGAILNTPLAPAGRRWSAT
jgi:hypothetical protein